MYLVVEVPARETDKRIAHRVHFLAHDAILEQRRRPQRPNNDAGGGGVRMKMVPFFFHLLPRDKLVLSYDNEGQALCFEDYHITGGDVVFRRKTFSHGRAFTTPPTRSLCTARRNSCAYVERCTYLFGGRNGKLGADGLPFLGRLHRLLDRLAW